MMGITRSWKVYGTDGHRQRESFCASYAYDMSEGDTIRVIDVKNADRTGTHDYTVITITRNTAEECSAELAAQLSDGIFENSRVGDVIEI